MPEHRDERAAVERRIDRRLRDAFGLAITTGRVERDKLRAAVETALSEELRPLWLLAFLFWWRRYAERALGQLPSLPSLGNAPTEAEALRRAVDAASRRAAQLADELAQSVADQVAAAGEAPPDLKTILSGDRATRIATTETTRTISGGEIAAADELGTISLQRIGRRPIWTIEDNAACKICLPLNGTGRDVWGIPFPEGPPAHPNCRCWLEWMIQIDGQDY